MNGDLVTISIPTYRRPSLLLHCLHACLAQDYRPLEIDISDNSPTDDTAALVATITPPPGIAIRYWRNIPAIDPIANQRKLFAMARGRRFVWMNDDDVLLPGAVRALADAFARAPDVVISYGFEQIINEAGELLPQRSAQLNRLYMRVPECAGLRRDLLVCAFQQQIPHVGFMVLTEAAQRVGVRGRDQVGLAADADFAIRLAQACRGQSGVLLEQPVVRTRAMQSGLSRTAPDVSCKLHDAVAAMSDAAMSAEEARARQAMLARLGPSALREHAMAGRRRAALRALRSCRLGQSGDTIRLAYALGLIAVPDLAHAARLVLPRGAGRPDQSDDRIPFGLRT